MDGWRSVRKDPPPQGRQVIGYHPCWIDNDFNPRGIRECFRTGDGTEWINATWVDHQDCYREGYEAPIMWHDYPKLWTSPVTKDTGILTDGRGP